VVLQRGNCEIVEIKIPGNKCGLVIGKGGETIKRLSEQFGVKLVVVQETSAATSGDKPLRITGEPDKVAKAKDAVMELLNPSGKPGAYQTNDYGSKSQYTMPGSAEVFIKVPGDKAGIVIGKGGDSIKEINRRSGAHVEIDKSQRGATDSSDKMFVIRGTHDQIQYAQQLIYEKITGVIGSVPPSGYFGADLSPVMSSYGRSDTATPNYQQQWNMAYQQQWQQAATDPKAAAADPNAAAWAAYYQQYYGQAVAGAVAQPAGSTTPNGTPTSATSQPTINPQTGQPDYSQAWVEYYRSLGMHEQADAILRQTQQQQTQSAGQTNGTSASASSSATSASSASAAGQSAGQSNASSAQQNGSAQQYAAASQASWAGYAGYGAYGN